MAAISIPRRTNYLCAGSIPMERMLRRCRAAVNWKCQRQPCSSASVHCHVALFECAVNTGSIQRALASHFIFLLLVVAVRIISPPLSMAQQPFVVYGLLIIEGFTITLRHTAPGRAPLVV